MRRVVIFRLNSIGYGFLLYLAVDRTGISRLDRVPGWLAAVALALTTVGAYAVLDRITASGNRAMEHLFPFAAALFGSAAILCALHAEASIQRIPALAWLGRYLGRVSYSTYLFHVILIELIGAALPAIGAIAQLALFLTALFGVTTLFYIYFERPILAARPRFEVRTPTVHDALNAAAPAGLGHKPRRQHALRGDRMPFAVPMRVAGDFENRRLPPVPAQEQRLEVDGLVAPCLRRVAEALSYPLGALVHRRLRV